MRPTGGFHSTDWKHQTHRKHGHTISKKASNKASKKASKKASNRAAFQSHTARHPTRSPQNDTVDPQTTRRHDYCRNGHTVRGHKYNHTARSTVRKAGARHGTHAGLDTRELYYLGQPFVEKNGAVGLVCSVDDNLTEHRTPRPPAIVTDPDFRYQMWNTSPPVWPHNKHHAYNDCVKRMMLIQNTTLYGLPYDNFKLVFSGTSFENLLHSIATLLQLPSNMAPYRLEVWDTDFSTVSYTNLTLPTTPSV